MQTVLMESHASQVDVRVSPSPSPATTSWSAAFVATIISGDKRGPYIIAPGRATYVQIEVGGGHNLEGRTRNGHWNHSEPEGWAGKQQCVIFWSVECVKVMEQIEAR